MTKSTGKIIVKFQGTSLSSVRLGRRRSTLYDPWQTGVHGRRGFDSALAQSSVHGRLSEARKTKCGSSLGVVPVD